MSEYEYVVRVTLPEKISPEQFLAAVSTEWAPFRTRGAIAYAIAENLDEIPTMRGPEMRLIAPETQT